MDNIRVHAIYFSKKKLSLLLIASFAFIAAGIWFIIDPPPVRILGIDSPYALVVLGYVVVIFFGIMGFFLGKKMFDNRPALIIDDEGLDDRSSMVPAGYVPWKDIKAVSVINVNRQKMIALSLYDPEPYLQSRSTFAKKTLNLNYKTYGTHFAIATNGLDVDFNELYKMLSERVGH